MTALVITTILIEKQRILQQIKSECDRLIIVYSLEYGLVLRNVVKY